jgi:hypothetical protein
MRHALIPTLALALLLAGCGGGGTDTLPQASDQIQRLNEHEAALTGAYDLTGFVIQHDGVWKTGDQVETWSGTLFLAYDHQASMTIEVEGELRILKGTWSADEGYLLLAGSSEADADVVAAWALTADGTLQTSFVQPADGDDSETWLWGRSGS